MATRQDVAKGLLIVSLFVEVKLVSLLFVNETCACVMDIFLHPVVFNCFNNTVKNL